jgi:tyrosine-protein kinase
VPSAPHGQGALGPYLRAIRAHKLLVVLATLAALGGAVAWLALRPVDYEARAQLLVTPLPQDDQTFLGFQLLRDSGDPTRTIQTAATLVESPEAARLAADRIGEGWTAGRVLDAIQVEPEGQSNILAVTATADRAELSARVANRFVGAALEVRSRALQRQIAQQLTVLRTRQSRTTSPGSTTAAGLADRINQLESVQAGKDPTLTLSQPASVPSSAAGRSPILIVALALVGGLVLGSGGAVLMELLDRRIREEDEMIALYPLPVLAHVPLLSRRERRAGKESVWYIPPAVREAFRTLVIQLGEGSDAGRVVMVTSASTGDGKTTSAVNLAVALAAGGDKVVLLDLDLRKPDVAANLGVAETCSLTAIGRGDRPLSDLVLPVPQIPSLSVLATEAKEGDAALIEALNRRLPELVAEARQLADYVVIDTAPLGEVSDALRIAPDVDDIVVVTRPGHTNRVNFEIMRDLLERIGQTPAGFLVIGEQQGRSAAYYGYGMGNRELFLDRAAGVRSSPPH